MISLRFLNTNTQIDYHSNTMLSIKDTILFQALDQLIINYPIIKNDFSEEEDLGWSNFITSDINVYKVSVIIQHNRNIQM